MNPASNIWTKPLFPSLADYVIIGVYLILIFIWAYHIQQKHRGDNPAYDWYVRGLFAKVVGAIALCLVYTLHYGRQDTLGFFISSEAMVNVLFQNPVGYFRLLFEGANGETLSFFTKTTGYPWYRDDIPSFFIVRITSIFTLFGFKNYFTTSILFAWFFFKGYWKLFLLLNKLFPSYRKEFAIAVFFFPSVMFWGSGILKDTVTLSMTGWFVYSVYFAFVLKEKQFKNIIAMLITGYFILVIKPYIIVALIPGVLIWFSWSYIRKQKNPILRFVLAPISTFAFLGIGLLILSVFSSSLGTYGSLEGMIAKAYITYDDHTRAVAYGTNFYDLGDMDGSLESMLSKAPLAIFTGLFRPLPWEARNIFMGLAALENISFLIFVLVIFWRTGFVKTLKIAFDEPLVIFALSFAIVFAFGVGISSGNFGALVRLKIPLLPFLAAGLFTLYRRSTELKKERENPEAKVFVQARQGIK